MDNRAQTRFHGMLGFAMRAGKVIIGTELVCAALSKGGVKAPRLVLVAKTASEGTKKKIRTKCEFYGVCLKEISEDGESLGCLLGKLYAPAVIAITDDRFAEEISMALNAMLSESDSGDRFDQ